MNINWRDFLERHGFGAFIALILILSMIGILPTPLFTKILAHTDRDQQRDAIMLALCLNVAKDDKMASDRCWDALTGVGEISRTLKDLEKRR